MECAQQEQQHLQRLWQMYEALVKSCNDIKVRLTNVAAMLIALGSARIAKSSSPPGFLHDQPRT